MTVKHIAWPKFKPEISHERINQHMDAGRFLVGRVPALINLECGADFVGRSAGFTHGIIVTVPDREALSEYLNHPEHIPVAAARKVDLDELRVLDFET